MLQTKNIVMIVVLAIVGVLTVGCTNDDNIIVDENPAASRTVILTTTVGFADTPAETRALDGNGKKTFEANEEVALIYTKSDGKKDVAVCTLADTDINSGGKSANLTFTLDSPMEGNSDVTFVYPASLADPDAADGISMTKLQANQDGTLATLSSNFDAATATDNMTVSGTTATLSEHIVLTNPLCIGKFTIEDNVANDITSKITQLTISDGRHNYIVDRTPAAGPIYVAMKPIVSSANISLTAVTSTTPYKKSVTNKALAANKIYPIKVTMEKDVDRATPLTLKAKNDNTEVTFTLASGYVQYSTDGGASWTDYTSGTAISLRKDETVSFRGDNATYTSTSNYSKISCSAECYIYGNIMSLISSSGYATATALTGANTFGWLFNGNTNITNDASKALVLPATTLTGRCYQAMFYNCTNLTTAPALPATTLTESCYSDMFNSCDGLTTAPALPATMLADYCYSSMFSGCTNLSTAPALPAKTLAKQCYAFMFSDCSNLTTAPTLPATTLTERCYFHMFSGCTSLTTAPVLPATTLTEGCYSSMFSGCTNLTTAPALPATTLAVSCYYSMFSDCTNLTTAPVLPATTLANSCYGCMFSDCTSLTTAPVLPAETLADKCYYYMFQYCTKLSSVTCLATNISASNCLTYWLDNAGTDASISERKLHVKSGQTGKDWNVPTTGPYAWTVEGDQ